MIDFLPKEEKHTDVHSLKKKLKVGITNLMEVTSQLQLVTMVVVEGKSFTN